MEIENKDIDLVPSEIMAYSLGQKRKGIIKARNSFFAFTVIMLGYAFWIFARLGFDFGFFLLLAMAGLMLLFAFLINRLSPSKEGIAELPAIADKMETGIENSHPRYLFFVKNGKWGVYDYKKCKVVLPARYDSIRWKTKGSVAIVESGASSMEIDVVHHVNQ